MATRTRVGILFGGRSVEHEVSLQSARNVVEALDRNRFEPVLIGVDKGGRWRLYEDLPYLENPDDPIRIRLAEGGTEVTLAPWPNGGRLIDLQQPGREIALDVVFPVIHGPLGEDGTLQGLLKLAAVPFVGPGVLASSVGMDKDVTKRLLSHAGIRVAGSRVIHAGDKVDPEGLFRELGRPLFVKPANLGSSVGVHKVRDLAGLETALEDAFSLDRKVLIEEFVAGREIECAVLGNRQPQASLPGEVAPSHEFYSYTAKYIDDNGAALHVPADLSPELVAEVQALAVRVFQVTGCEGMARIDFFLTPDRNWVVNEINTIPGFTRISMYPLLWQASGLSYPGLITRLIELALERWEQESHLRDSYVPH